MGKTSTEQMLVSEFIVPTITVFKLDSLELKRSQEVPQGLPKGVSGWGSAPSLVAQKRTAAPGLSPALSILLRSWAGQNQAMDQIWPHGQTRRSLQHLAQG